MKTLSSEDTSRPAVGEDACLDQATLEELLEGVDQPARYIGGEANAVVKATAQARIALAFPDVYEVAESHLGLKILYDIVNQDPRFAAERSYAPWPDLEARLRARRIPLWSLETRRPLSAFDLVGFTLQFELGYPTLLAMLELGGIPLWQRERGDAAPLVIAGGAGAANPEPVADFFDAILLGDGEEAILELLASALATRGRPRAERLAALGALPGVYVPSHYRVSYRGLAVDALEALPGVPQAHPRSRHGTPRVRRRVVQDLDAAPYPTRVVIPNIEPVHDRVALEIQRGCARGCRFCQAGMTNRPTRQRRPETLLRLADEGLAATGCDVVSLLSLSAGDYANVDTVLREFFARYQSQRLAISLPSLRSESLGPELAAQLARGRKATFTLAPEAGSERLRQVINKTNTEADLLAAVRAAMSAGWRQVKLYFMIGLPTETDADLAAIVELARRARDAGREVRGDARVTVAISTFVPKPHTPLQWEAQLSSEETRRRQLWLRDALRRERIEMRYHSPEQSFCEGVLSRGDRRLAPALVAAMRAGCRLDAWTERYAHDRWLTAFSAALAPHGLAPADYLAARDEAALLPWDHLDMGVLKKYLRHERQRARRAATIEDCALADRCYACGACDLADPYLTPDPATGRRVVRLRPRLAPRVEARLPDPAPAEDGPPVARSRLRFRLAKRGTAVHFSHLDLATHLTRAVRQVRLPVLYSAGHTPRPRLSFSPACPTGMTSEAEFLEADCTGFPDPARYLERLNAVLPKGLEVLEGHEVPYETPPIGELIESTRYRVTFADATGLAEATAALLARRHQAARVIRKGQPRLLDARAAVLEARVDGATLELTLAFRRSGNLKIGEAIGLLAPERAAGARLHKLAVSLRAAPLPAEAEPARFSPVGAVDLTPFSDRRAPSPPDLATRPFADE